MYLFSLQERYVANISTGMPFNDVSPDERVIDVVHLAIAIMYLTNYLAT